MLTPDQQALYQDPGHLVLPGFKTATEVAALVDAAGRPPRAAARALPHRSQRSRHASYTPHATDGRAPHAVHHGLQRSPALPARGFR